jgi:hypothetical protein
MEEKEKEVVKTTQKPINQEQRKEKEETLAGIAELNKQAIEETSAIFKAAQDFFAADKAMDTARRERHIGHFVETVMKIRVSKGL